MVLYFTGTGNSRHIAERIAHALNDTLISLNDRIKSGDITPLAVNGRLVLVMPTYAWRIPRIVRDHLLRTELRGARETWFVMDCGSEIGNAAKYNRALCREKRASSTWARRRSSCRRISSPCSTHQPSRRRAGSSPKPSRSSTARSPRSAQDTCSRRRAKTLRPHREQRGEPGFLFTVCEGKSLYCKRCLHRLRQMRKALPAE